MERFDVVVVGAGLSGLQATRILAARGLSVLLTDRKSDLGSAVHTTGIFVRKTFEEFDLPQRLLGPPVRKVNLYSPRRRVLPLASRHDEFRVGDMAGLYHHMLAEAIAAGATFRGGWQHTNSEPLGSGSAVRFITPAGSRYVRARFVIGADGAQSTVARDLGLSRNRSFIVGIEDLLPGGQLRQDGEPLFHCFLDPVLAPGYLAWLIDDGRSLHAGVGGYGDMFDPGSALRSFRAELEQRFGLDSSLRGERRGGLIPIGGILPRLACPRGLLVGDAAGAVSPLTAGGLDPAMRLSAMAAEVTHRFLENGLQPAVLAPYAGDSFAPRFVSRRFMRRLFRWMAHPATIETAFSLLARQPLQLLARHVFFGRGSFPDVPALQSSWVEPRTLPPG